MAAEQMQEETDFVVAFDVDGTLETPRGMARWEVYQKKDAIVGIVSARSREDIEKFVEDSGVEPEFIRGGFRKRQSLSTVKEETKEVDGVGDSTSFIYFGNRVRDRIAARTTGWVYERI